MIDSDGRTVRELLLGDGIKDVQTNTAGEIWVSYFDEGVYGGVWRSPSGEPYERHGLVRVSADGEVSYGFSPASSSDVIDDCYALNVATDATWACYYSSFPVLRIAPNGSVDAWSTGENGISALAVAGDMVLLAGGYAEERGRLLSGRLTNDGLIADKQRLGVMKQGKSRPLVLVGRGPILHRVTNTTWRQFDVRSARS